MIKVSRQKKVGEKSFSTFVIFSKNVDAAGLQVCGSQPEVGSEFIPRVRILLFPFGNMSFGTI